MHLRFDFRCCIYFHRWAGGWSEDWRAMLNSTQDQVEVEFEVLVELGNMVQKQDIKNGGKQHQKATLSLKSIEKISMWEYSCQLYRKI